MSELDDLLDPGVKNNGGKPSGSFSGDKLPNANATLVLGIISIVTCWLYAIPGLVTGIIALALHKKDKDIHKSDPDRYTESFKNSRAGFICAIIGTSLSGLYVLVLLFAVVLGVTAASRF